MCGILAASVVPARSGAPPSVFPSLIHTVSWSRCTPPAWRGKAAVAEVLTPVPSGSHSRFPSHRRPGDGLPVLAVCVCLVCVKVSSSSP